MIKKLLAGLALSLVATHALAADMATSTSDNWSGPYIGFQVGSIANESDFSCHGGEAPCDSFTLDSSLTNASAGVYGGFNLELNPVVIGLEGDYNGSFGKQDWGYDSLPWASVSEGFELSQKFTASVRARLGILVSEDLMLFGTAGYAWADYNLDNPNCVGDCTAWPSTNYIQGTRSAPIYGGGIEYALTSNAHIKLQYLYADFGKKSWYDTSSDLVTHQVHAGISWNF